MFATRNATNIYIPFVSLAISAFIITDSCLNLVNLPDSTTPNPVYVVILTNINNTIIVIVNAISVIPF